MESFELKYKIGELKNVAGWFYQQIGQCKKKIVKLKK